MFLNTFMYNQPKISKQNKNQKKRTPSDLKNKTVDEERAAKHPLS